MNIFAPKNKYELGDIIKFSKDFEHPLAIRYPRGTAYDGLKEFRAPIEHGKSEYIYQEKDIALLAVGSMVSVANEVRDELKQKGYNVSLINARFVKPLDEEMLLDIIGYHDLIVTMEENVLNGGYGERVLRFLMEQSGNFNVINIAIPNVYVEHGNVDLLKKELRIDKDSVVKRILEKYER